MSIFGVSASVVVASYFGGVTSASAALKATVSMTTAMTPNRRLLRIARSSLSCTFQ